VTNIALPFITLPEGSNESGVDVGVEAIPGLYAQRRANRGFEAVAYENGTSMPLSKAQSITPTAPTMVARRHPS
jgi:hypothetical protein